MKAWAIALLSIGAWTVCAAAEDLSAILQRQTQELFDAITSGSPAVWERYLDAGARITAEDGRVFTKAEMVKDIRPLPSGVSGSIEVIDFKVVPHGAAAVTTYVCDEHENYHGQKLHCQYRTTDTWLKTKAGWRLIASQVLALRTDPPAVNVDTRAYVGRYTLADGITYEIRERDGKLEGQRNGRPAEALLAEAPDVLFVPGSPRYRKIFKRDEQGKIAGFAERREAWDLVWTRLP